MLISFYSRDIFILESAARSDGATRFQALYLVAIPLIAPGLIAAGLLGFILSWNEFIFVLILSGKGTATLPIGLSTLSTHRGLEIALLAAATTLTVAPAFFNLTFFKEIFNKRFISWCNKIIKLKKKVFNILNLKKLIFFSDNLY